MRRKTSAYMPAGARALGSANTARQRFNPRSPRIEPLASRIRRSQGPRPGRHVCGSLPPHHNLSSFQIGSVSSPILLSFASECRPEPTLSRMSLFFARTIRYHERGMESLHQLQTVILLLIAVLALAAIARKLV